MFHMKFGIAQRKDGTFTVNQESNGYWWYHDRSFETRQDAEQWCETRCSEGDTFEIMPDNYRPLHMR